ncbi:hypothetical protein DICPUDRAFT_35595 [Dictyostelium purpureum]|uniref:Enoyl-CoA hydratase n=1 Tax=Dictyostelium purpureum TaxID=5786 RepID=F0ZPK5_DICPU|nr:uncharacterized protein DICPUDRAFT_35595 [Dictyostelium purpureum]EGC34115.1 hypothetical protein DICPUDRAFT_35595 [Dictyostelium purpureum]|eukprot:XP_003289361.1 hypothetical protein DICPUDRAFT_35595 [Dictyostelium purpureum]
MKAYTYNNDDSDNLKFKIINNNILIVKINRNNRRNAVDKKTANKLYSIFKEFNKDDKLDVAILYGGKDSFCSGADLKELSNGFENGNKVISPKETDYGPMGCTRLKLDKPVICAISGYCVAGGLELALWCDLRVSSSKSIFGVFCRRWGVPLIDGGTIRLPRLIGHSRAMDLILTGRQVLADEALQIGLVNRVVEVHQVLESSIELAKLISSFPKKCLRRDRLSAIEQWDLDANEALENEYRLGIKSLSEEGQKGSINFKKGQGRHGIFFNNTNNNSNNNTNNLISKL